MKYKSFKIVLCKTILGITCFRFKSEEIVDFDLGNTVFTAPEMIKRKRVWVWAHFMGDGGRYKEHAGS
ncbi:hypothetical protein Hanom_Chr04g00368751 [Helianthus anomalus]